MHTTRSLRQLKNSPQPIQMLTCYDYQNASMLAQTDVDLILVGDSLGNVILGLDNTVQVTLDHMIIFASAVRRGAPNKFIVVDMPFGTYSTLADGLKNATRLFQETQANAVKIEGAFPHQLELVERLTQCGIPVMGHIGLIPQSVHQLGGYYTHGKDEKSRRELIEAAKNLEQAGAFSLVLECVLPEVSQQISSTISIPTIGIGSGNKTDGQVLVLNDLLHLGPDRPPKFCTPVANLFELKKDLVQQYILAHRLTENQIEQ